MKGHSSEVGGKGQAVWGWKSSAESRGRAFGGLLGDKAPNVAVEEKLPEAEQFLLPDKHF